MTTGCDELNHLFGGGIESSAITEFAGEFRTGKTQLCLTLCVTSFLPRAIGGGEGRAMFLDTEGTFRPERLGPIAARFELDHDFVMENVLHQRVLNCDHLDECLQEAAAVLADDSDGPFRVLIVDSIIALYRQEFPGRGELSERQQRIGKVMQDLKSLSEVFNLGIAHRGSRALSTIAAPPCCCLCLCPCRCRCPGVTRSALPFAAWAQR